MGGFGSGRPGFKPKAGRHVALDVNLLQKAGRLAPGREGSWSWLQNGAEMGHIGTRGADDALTLSYRIRCGHEGWLEIEYDVPLARVPCRYGGTRPYFLCPGNTGGRSCGRRVAKLYLVGLCFLCRHCHRITYRDRSERRFDRLFGRANKLRMAMDGEPGTDSSLPTRPKGMHRATYERRIAAILAFEKAGWAEFAPQLVRRYPNQNMRQQLQSCGIEWEDDEP